MASRFTKRYFQELVRTLPAMGTDELAALVQYANHKYHSAGEPVMSDEMYDVVKERLANVSPGHPMLTCVGAVVADEDKRKERLPAWMGSMDKVKEADALSAYLSRTAAVARRYVVADKLDGVSALLLMDGASGEAKLYSRGDGVHGQNISHLIPLIPGLHAAVAGIGAGGIGAGDKDKEVLVRGELILTRADFGALQHLGANARNMVAGVVNAKLPDLGVLARVRFVAYSLLQPEGMGMLRQFGALAAMGFEVVPHAAVQQASLSLEWLSARLLERRKASPYEVDGVIVSADAWEAPVVGSNPAQAMAFKSLAAQEVAEATVTGVEWNVSKDGYWKPVVVFEPVALAGVTIQRATGFNAEFIHANVLGPGARVAVTRSGDVIPYIVATLKPAAAGQPCMPPEGQWDWTASKKDACVVNENAEMELRQLQHFFDKLDIKGVSEKTVERLYEAGFKTASDVLTRLTDAEALRDVKGVANKGALPAKVQEAVRAADCATLMQASNAFGRGFGERRLQAALRAFPDLLVATPGVAQVMGVEGFSTITAEAFVAGVQRFKEFLAAASINAASLNVSACAAAVEQATGTGTSQALAGWTVVFSGLRDAELEARVKRLGGSVGAAVTKAKKDITLVVTKDVDGGSGKLRAAKELGVRVLSVADFEREYA